jgi:hypothetical protein
MNAEPHNYCGGDFTEFMFVYGYGISKFLIEESKTLKPSYI